MSAEVVTTALLWRATGGLCALAAVGVGLLCRFVPRALFASLRESLVAVTFAVWFVIWAAMVTVYWESVYAYFFAPWLRWAIPALMATGFSLVSWGLWRVAVRARRGSVLLFLLLGALLGPLTHLWAVYRGIVSRPPMLRGASPVAAVLVSAPEFAIYFSVILALSAGLRAMFGPGGRRPGKGK